ncbi:MAG: AAA family ATPase [Deltaproteobacteria bacterium]|nr:AAA family ATPase [Deltaproteobacteria bacterium]
MTRPMRDGDLQALRDEVRRRVSVLDVVQGRGIALQKVGAEWIGRCPFHDDGTPSLRVNPTKDGGVWKCDPCNQGGDAIRFVERLDRSSFADALRRIAGDHGITVPAAAPTVAAPREVAVYRYEDAAGVLLGAKRRWEPAHDGSGKRKSFTWEGPDGCRGQPKPWAPTLYRLPEVVSAIGEGRTVLVVEGEKCADVLAAAGFVATTNEDGAGKWRAEHASHLRGACVVVLADNDEPGRAHAADVLRSLRGVAASARAVELPDLPPKGDAADFLAEHTAAELSAALDAPQSWASRLAEARAALAAVGVGHAGQGADCDQAAPFFAPAAELFSRTFPSTPWLVRGLLTDRAVFAVAGEPKTAKTWASLEIAMALGTGTPAFGELEAVGGPRSVALFMVEDDAQSTRNRLRALATSRGLAPEVACARLHVENLAALDVRNPEHLARLVASVWAIPEPVAAVVLDPLRDVHTAEENSSTEMAEVMRALRALRTVLGCAVVFVHHSHKAGAEGKGRRPGQRMRGSSAIHGAVDGGLYLLDLTGNLETEWVMKAQAEVKRARSAGFFSLTLTVEDDANGEAVAARWTFDRSGAGARGCQLQTAADRIEAVAGVLRAADCPLGVREIEKRLNVRHGEVTGPLKDLEREGKTRRTRRGWAWADPPTLSPSPSLYRDGDRDQRAERSPGPLGTDGDGDETGEWLGGAT